MGIKETLRKCINTALILGALPAGVFGTDVLKTQGFTTCLNNSTITVNNLNIEYNRATGTVTFDVAGSSSKQQNVTAVLTVNAYGKKVYEKSFDPCDPGAKVDQLCPGKGLGCVRLAARTNTNFFYLVPVGDFKARGNQSIPSMFASQIPAIAFTVPDLEGEARLELKALDTNESLACIESNVNNGKTANVPAVSYVTVGIAGVAFVLTGLSALGGGGGSGSQPSSPNFGEVVGWLQSMAMNGMLSVNYPPVYRSFSKNFAFSTGLVPWDGMQSSIDSFRKRTGGNLTADSVQYLRNTTLVYSDGSTANSSSIAKRSINFLLGSRDLTTSINGTQSGNATAGGESQALHVVHGIQGYVETLSIPKSNTFMTVLLLFAIVVAAIAVGILLFKIVLEAWALFGSFPPKLTSFRKRYWGLLGRTITSLILLLYGIWTLYCVFQFTNGDSWAAKVLAGVTLAIFTGILGFFTFRIWQLAQRYKKAEGDASALFEDKENWRNYSLFYDVYKKGYWWLFMPAIIYMFAKGCVIAAGNGHGLTQTAGQLVIESLMLALVLWSRPFVTKAGNWINIIIQIVRVLSVACILLFVRELGISQSTKTITGVVLIGMQSVLTGVLAILVAVNGFIVCCKTNPHRKQRKEAGEFFSLWLSIRTLTDHLQKKYREISKISRLLMSATPYSCTLPTIGTRRARIP